MTHPIYSSQDLAAYKLADLKRIGRQVGASCSDMRSKQAWISAILAVQPQPVAVVKAEEIPQKLIEETALELLGVEVYDIETNIDFCIPEGDIQYQVLWFNETLGGISKKTIGDSIWYYSHIPGVRLGRCCRTMFQAISEFLLATTVVQSLIDARSILEKRFKTAPDYI